MATRGWQLTLANPMRNGIHRALADTSDLRLMTRLGVKLWFGLMLDAMNEIPGSSVTPAMRERAHIKGDDE